MLKRIFQLTIAATVGLVLFEVGPGTLFSFGPITGDYCLVIVLCLAVLSLGTPKKFMWMTLACWAFYFGWWSIYELGFFNRGDLKFGPMMLPYGIAGVVLGVASWLSLHGRAGQVNVQKVVETEQLLASDKH